MESLWPPKICESAYYCKKVQQLVSCSETWEKWSFDLLVYELFGLSKALQIANGYENQGR